MNPPAGPRHFKSIIAFLVLAFTGFPAVSAPTEWAYMVRSGDTLISIGENFLARPGDWTRLQQANHIRNPRRLIPGSLVRIPLALLKQEPIAAEVARTHGEVKVLRATSGDALTLAAGMKLQRGDRIVTGSGANATLIFVDGSTLLIQENSRVEMESLARYRGPETADTRVKLETGRVETDVRPLTGPGARYEIKTPPMTLGVRGTHFRVGTDEAAGVARSEVLEGKVAAAGSAKPVLIGAGFGTLAEAGKAPSAAKPLLPAPELGAVPALLERVPLRFQWQSLGGATRYRAQVFADKELHDLVADGTFAEPRARFADLPDGSYHLRVRGIDAEGLEGRDAVRGFRLKARPEPPFITQPGPKARVFGEGATFTWTASSVATTYHLEVATDEGFTHVLADRPELRGISQTENLQPGNYFWRIASRTADGDQGPFSETQSFIQRATPPVPPPPSMDENTLMFRWPAGDVPVRQYQFQLARDRDFKEIVAEKTVTEPAVTLPRPEGGEYFVRVRGVEQDGFEGPYTAAQTFTIPHPIRWSIVIPMLLAPFLF